MYFRFPDFWSTLIKRNCHNSRISDDIDLKLGPVTKIDKRNKKRQKFEAGVISENYGQFGEIRKPNSGRIVCKAYIFINILQIISLIPFILQKLKAELKNL